MVAHLLLLFRPDRDFLARPFLEDAFYSLSVARSIGNGTGLTIDGVHATNGVQPLICFLYAPFFALSHGDTFMALRLAMGLDLVTFILAVLAISRFFSSLRKGGRGERKLLFWIAAGVLIWNYTIPAMFLNGLETGLSVGLAFWAAAYYNERIAPENRPPLLRSALLGAILGLAVLARIDLAFLVVSIIVWHLYRMHRRHTPAPGEARNIGALVRTLLECLLIGGVSVAVSAPWWLYNLTRFGSLVPISGQAQQMLIGNRLWVVLMTIHSLSDAFLMVVHTSAAYVVGFYTIVLGIFLFAIVSAAVFAVPAWRGAVTRSVVAVRERWQWGGVAPLAFLSVILIVYYSFYFSAPHFQWRYLITPRILIMLWIVALLFDLWGELPRRSMLRGLITLGGIGLAAVAVFIYRGNFRTEGNNIFLVPADWIRSHVPPAERVGMFQSGTTGFLFPGEVVNLDGKVNADALRAFQRKRLPRYVDSMGFAYIIDWDIYTKNVFADPSVRQHYVPIDTLPFEFVVWKRTSAAK